MFVLISLVLSLAVLAVFIHLSQTQRGNLERKFEILILLRQILLLTRQHRAITHQTLSTHQRSAGQAKLGKIYDAMVVHSNKLIAQAPFENRPIYRVLQLKLKSLHADWDKQTIARNQVTHGKVVRHCMFLMDEIAIAWLIDAGREEVTDEYHLHWQQVLDSMEVLTQLRISIQELHYPEGPLRIKYYCTKTMGKLNQLSVIRPLMMASPTCLRCMSLLKGIGEQEHLELTEEELYRLTSDISLLICDVYDKILSDMTESLYQPLPQLTFHSCPKQ